MTNISRSRVFAALMSLLIDRERIILKKKNKSDEGEKTRRLCDGLALCRPKIAYIIRGLRYKGHRRDSFICTRRGAREHAGESQSCFFQVRGKNNMKGSAIYHLSLLLLLTYFILDKDEISIRLSPRPLTPVVFFFVRVYATLLFTFIRILYT